MGSSEALWLAGDHTEAAGLAERAAEFCAGNGATAPESRARSLTQAVAASQSGSPSQRRPAGFTGNTRPDG
jgi:hypothetical protein